MDALIQFEAAELDLADLETVTGGSRLRRVRNRQSAVGDDNIQNNQQGDNNSFSL